MRKKAKVHIEYEGMGACVEATIYMNDKLVCVIHTHDTAMNELTIKAAKAVKDSFEKSK